MNKDLFFEVVSAALVCAQKLELHYEGMDSEMAQNMKEVTKQLSGCNSRSEINLDDITLLIIIGVRILILITGVPLDARTDELRTAGQLLLEKGKAFVEFKPEQLLH